MAQQFSKISFVSGKGGVGKTSLAVNFAWICSHFAKTVILDLDFQNQGATGLLCSYLPSDCRGLVEPLLKSASLKTWDLVKLDANLYFVPSVPLQNPPRHSELFALCQGTDFAPRLQSVLNALHEEHGFEIVILDCHGGLDMVSLAAHRLSDHTLVITEADRVTFNGTLELLDFYQAAPTARATAAGYAQDIDTSRVTRPNPVKIIVNRIPPKYEWDDLERVYNNVLHRFEAYLNNSNSILVYIPNEEIVSESFGQIAFLVKIAPNSVMTEKLHLLAYKLFASSFQFPPAYKPLARLSSERRRKKLDRVLASVESRNIRAIFMTFAVISNAYVLLFLGGLSFWGWVILRSVGKTAYEPSTAGYYILAIAIFVYFLLTSAFMLRAAFGLRRFYKDKYQIYRNILRQSHEGPTFWQRIAVVRLSLLRVVTAILPYIVILTVAFPMLYIFWLIVSTFSL